MFYIHACISQLIQKKSQIPLRNQSEGKLTSKITLQDTYNQYNSFYICYLLPTYLSTMKNSIICQNFTPGAVRYSMFLEEI